MFRPSLRSATRTAVRTLPSRPALTRLAMLPRLALLASAVLLTLGCGTVQAGGQAAAVAEAEQAYVDGMEHLSGGSLLEAETDFGKVLKAPSYLTLTSLARLRLADAYYHQQKYDEAIDTYLSFVQRHDGSPNVPYALFMVAKAHYEMAPSDLWIMPPAYELDLTPVATARTHLERFLKQFPKSRLATEAIQLREKCIDLQWANTDYVVKFYQKRKQWMGVVFRLHQAAQHFPTRAHTLSHYALLAEAYGHLGWRARAVEMWQAIAQRWPGSAEAQVARSEIPRLQADIQAGRQRKDPAAEMPPELPPTAALRPEQMSGLDDV